MKRLLILFAVSLLLRLVFMAVVELPVTRDGEDYLRLADHLLKTGEYGYDAQSRTYRGPTYPLFVAACQMLTSSNTPEETATAVGWIQSILSAFLPLVVYGLARRGFEERTALLAGYLCAVYPDLIFYSGMVMTESLSLLFMLAGMLAFIVAWEARGSKSAWACASGALLVAAFLSRGLSISGVAGILIWVLLRRRTIPARPRHVCLVLVLFVLGSAAVELPWVARNYKLHGEIVPNTIGHFWHTVYGGYTDVALYNEFEAPDYLFSPALSEVEEDARLKEDTLRWIKSHPALSGLLVYTRSLRFWIPWRDIEVTGLSAPWPSVLTVLSSAAAFGLLLLIAPFGVALRRPWTALDGMLLVHLAAVFALCCLIHWETRYRLSVVPVLLIYTADLWAHRHAYVAALKNRLAGYRLRASLAALFVLYHVAGSAVVFLFFER